MKRVWGGTTHALKILADSALRRETREQFERMKREGVDTSDAADRQAWIRAQGRTLRRLQGKAPRSRPEPKISRNALFLRQREEI
ncbi:MAG: hypothetical protein IPN19_12810 [Elusimicrobia bacterium]|nr:hypothetical protein [Elusimicrobiota bacterium]